MEESFIISKAVRLVVRAANDSLPNVTEPVTSPLRLELGLPSTSLSNQTRSLIADIPLRITNQSPHTITLYNPRLDYRLIWTRKCINLAVLTADEQYLGDWFDLPFVNGGACPNPDDWLRFPPGGTIAFPFRFRAANFVYQTAEDRKWGLPPGNYSIELRAYQGLLVLPPQIIYETGESSAIRAHSTYKAWLAALPGKLIARSNRAQIEIPSPK